MTPDIAPRAFPDKLFGFIAKSRWLIKKRRILVLGDSHARIFTTRPLRWRFPMVKFTVKIVRGATVSGLPNPGSQTQAYPQFKRSLEEHGRNSNLIIVYLGEVDCGFVIWYRSQKHKLPVEEMLQQAIKRYSAFLDEVTEYGPLIVISAPLPTIKDNQDWGEVAHLRRNVKASQKERTQLTLRFNSIIAEYCQKHGATYINLDPESIGPDGLVLPKLLHANPLDHHYTSKQHARLLIKALSPHIAWHRNLTDWAKQIYRTHFTPNSPEWHTRQLSCAFDKQAAGLYQAEWRKRISHASRRSMHTPLTVERNLRLLLGVGRSGTTWIANSLARSNRKISFYEEPLRIVTPPLVLCNYREDHTAIDFCLKASPEADNLRLAYQLLALPDSRSYLTNFGQSHRNRNRIVPDADMVLIKEVHGLMATEFLARNMDCRFLLIRRNLLYLLDSIMAHCGDKRNYLYPEYQFIKASDMTTASISRHNDFIQSRIRETEQMNPNCRQRLLSERMVAAFVIQEYFAVVAAKYPNAMLVDYDKILLNRDSHFSSMAEFLGLKYTPGDYQFTDRQHITRTDRELRERKFKSLTPIEIGFIKDFISDSGGDKHAGE